jgi:hypothetical protein
MRDKVTVIIAVTISAFVLLALLGAFVLAIRGQDPGEIFPKVFDLVAVMVGAVAGFITGSTLERKREAVPDDREVEPVPVEAVSLTSPLIATDDSDSPVDD